MTKPVTLEIGLKLLEMRAKQAGNRRDHYRHHDLKEIRAMKFLAHRLYGNMGLLEAGANEPGVVWIGYYIDPPKDPLGHVIPNHLRRRKLMISGNTHRELVDQAKLLEIVR